MSKDVTFSQAAYSCTRLTPVLANAMGAQMIQISVHKPNDNGPRGTKKDRLVQLNEYWLTITCKQPN